MLSFRMNETLASRLQVAADGAGESLSEWMRTALIHAAGEPGRVVGAEEPYPGTATRIGE